MFQFFSKVQDCLHSEITPDMDAGYCPDCGEYVENQWFLTRCSCCGLKQKSIVLKGQVSPKTKFCRNCGSGVFYVEKLSKINFVDIHYAVLIKNVVKNNYSFFTQCWADNSERFTPKLIGLLK